MNLQKAGFVGLGLIGGSVAKAIRQYVPDCQIVAFDKNKEALALAIQENMNRKLSIARPRVAKENRTYYLLKRSPGVINIVECGFLTNPEEAALLQTEKYQRKVAEAVADGIVTYLKKQKENENN